jgi:signal transduction histidine kinase
MGLWILLKSYNAQYQLLVQTKNEKEEANEKLELLNQKKTKVLALLSHDLKSPMASLQLTLELFEMGILNQSNMETYCELFYSFNSLVNSMDKINPETMLREYLKIKNIKTERPKVDLTLRDMNIKTTYWFSK